jgi:hypothetical protein
MDRFIHCSNWIMQTQILYSRIDGWIVIIGDELEVTIFDYDIIFNILLRINQ